MATLAEIRHALRALQRRPELDWMMTRPTTDVRPTSQPDGVWLWAPVVRDPDVAAQLRAINNRLGVIMATLAEILDGFRAWGQSWKDRANAETARADAAVAALTEAQAAAQTSADALAAFQADDAATDASQIANQAQADADAAQAALDAALAADQPPAPAEEPPADVTPTDVTPAEEPPADVAPTEG